MGFWSNRNEARSARISARVESREQRGERRGERRAAAVDRANRKRIDNGTRTPLRSSTWVRWR